MSQHKDLLSIGNIYGAMLNKLQHEIVRESKHTKVPVNEIGDAPLVKGGPQETSGYMQTKLDKNKLSKKELEDNAYNIKNISYSDDDDCCDEDEEDFSEETKKIARTSLNTFMRKRSIFDKLFENAMNGSSFGGDTDMNETEELNALDIGGGEEDGMDDMDMGDEGDGDQITVTLDREVARQLCDILQAAMGDDMDMGDDMEDDGMGDDMEGDMGEDDGMEDEENCDYNDEDEEDLGHPNTGSIKNVDMGKNNKVGNVKPRGGSASSAYTSKVGPDGDHGHALVNGKQPNMGKNNKVGNLKTGKSLFD